MGDENKKAEEIAQEASEELNLDDLDEVAGGVGLKNVQKVQTTDISQSTTSRI